MKEVGCMRLDELRKVEREVDGWYTEVVRREEKNDWWSSVRIEMQTYLVSLDHLIEDEEKVRMN